MEHVSFVLRIDPAHQEEYKKRHEQVYPALEAEFAKVGIRRYHIYFHEGLLFAYMEVENYDAAMKHLADNQANKDWQLFMSDMLLPWENGEMVKRIPEMYKFTS